MTDSDLVVRLAEMSGEIRSLIGEAHGVMKDLRKLTADARVAAKTAVDDEVAEEVRRQLDAFQSITQEAMAASVAKVEAEFEELARLLTGRGAGKTPLRNLITEAQQLRCPECGSPRHGHIGYESAPGVVVEPVEGDWSVCRRCGMVSRFDAHGGLRKITTAELAQAMAQQGVAKAVAEVRAAMTP